ncbi:MAG: glycosyltransferase [Eggerthellaceae bacterium]|nr:glycosyltransferase [Eggerthellaceae bacterium]
MPKLSVIVPIYNVEEYLEECLDSLCAQSFSDFEVLCVNDGTTDASREIAQRYADNDPRFVIIDKANGGLSSARNAGILAALAPWLCFLDSDDFFTGDACERIVAAFERTDADVLTFGAYCYPPSAGFPWLEKHLSPRDIEYHGFSADLIFKEMSRPFAWRTACKKSFLIEKQLFFDEGLLFGEDQVFHFALYPRSIKTVLASDKLYHYRVSREGSLMHRVNRDRARKSREHLNIIRKIFADWESGGFLRDYPAEMIAWTVDFALLDIMRVEVSERDELVEELCRIWLCYFPDTEIAGLELPKATKALVGAVLYKPQYFMGQRRRLLLYSYDIEQNGIRAVMKDLFRRLRG